MDKEAWRTTVHRVTKSWTQLSTHIFLTYFFAKLLITCTIDMNTTGPTVLFLEKWNCTYN